MSLSRRGLLGYLGGTALIGAAGCTAAPAPSSTPAASAQPSASTGSAKKVALLLAGSSTDKGFMQSGFEGAQRAEQEFGIKVTLKEGVKPNDADLEAALKELAAGGAGLVVAHGGQNAKAAAAAAGLHPGVTFVVTQANVTGANLAGYEVLQEQSAWLAGAAAGLLTKTGVVGHMSGIRPVPGLKGRAAYVAGVAHTNPQAKVLTNFSGNQDDTALAKKIALAEIAAGADIIFTMLNAGRPGVAEAMTETGKGRQIGNVIDYTTVDPKIFVASAVANSGFGVYLAIKAYLDGTFRAGSHNAIGLEAPDACRLTLAPDVPDTIRIKIAELAQQIADGKIKVVTEYTGPEFNVP